MRTKFRVMADEMFFFFGFSVLSGGYTELPLRVMTPRMELGDSNPFNTVAMVLLLSGLLVLGGGEWRRLLAFARQAPAVTCYVALAALSVLWSFDPMVTMRRSVTLGIGVGFGLYAASRFPMDGVIRRIALVSAVLALTSTFVAVTMPHYGVMREGELAGRWNGVFPHKQQLGQAMFLGIFTFAWLLPRARGRWERAVLAGATLLSFFVLVMARSETATVSVLAIPALYAFMRACAMPGVARFWAIYAFAIVLIAGLTLLVTDVGAIMGRSNWARSKPTVRR